MEQAELEIIVVEHSTTVEMRVSITLPNTGTILLNLQQSKSLIEIVGNCVKFIEENKPVKKTTNNVIPFIH